MPARRYRARARQSPRLKMFLAGLALADAVLVSVAKGDLLVGSLVCGVIGYLLLHLWLPAEKVRALEPAPTHQAGVPSTRARLSGHPSDGADQDGQELTDPLFTQIP